MSSAFHQKCFHCISSRNLGMNLEIGENATATDVRVKAKQTARSLLDPLNDGKNRFEFLFCLTRATRFRLNYGSCTGHSPR